MVSPDGINKVCSKCEATKLVTDFNKNKSKADGRDHECRECRRKFYKTYSESPKGRLTVRNNQLRLYYKIDHAEYEALLEKQGGVCAICKKPPSSFTRRLHVDHDHNTGRVRGILCFKCNRALGLFEDSQDLLTAARSYIATAAQEQLLQPSPPVLGATSLGDKHQCLSVHVAIL